MKLFLGLLWGALVVASTNSAYAQTAWTADMTAVAQSWDTFLGKYVNTKGGVDYQAIVAGVGQDELKQVLDSYSKLDPTALDDRSKKALYINFYNAGMIFNVLQWAKAAKVDVKSDKFLDQTVNKIDAPGGNIWNGDWKFKIKGIAVNLDDIEHNLIRGGGKGDLVNLKVKELDPRIHSAVNCAAFSCPRVREKSYRPETIDQMLDENMGEWLSNNEQFSKLSDSKLKINQIVFWYYSDFDDVARDKMKLGGAGDFLAKFVKADASDAAWKKQHLSANLNGRSKFSLKLSSAFEFFYDWRIADSRRKK